MRQRRTYFILSTNMVLHVNGRGSTVSGRLVTGPFDLPFTKEADAKL